MRSGDWVFERLDTGELKISHGPTGDMVQLRISWQALVDALPTLLTIKRRPPETWREAQALVADILLCRDSLPSNVDLLPTEHGHLSMQWPNGGPAYTLIIKPTTERTRVLEFRNGVPVIQGNAENCSLDEFLADEIGELSGGA